MNKNIAISVIDYGADPTGVKDSLSAFKAALAALPSRGGDLWIPAGKYQLSNTLVIGNGKVSQDSTVQCVRLIGDGLPKRGFAQTGQSFADYSGTVLYRSGTLTGPMIQFDGPMGGCGINNLYINANNIASHCLITKNCEKFSAINSYFSTATQIGWEITSHQNLFRSYHQPNSSNIIIDSCVFDSINYGVTNLKLDGDLIGNGSDSNLIYMTNSNFIISGLGGTGIHFLFCDSSTFSNISCYRDPTPVTFNKATQTFAYTKKPSVNFQLVNNDTLCFQSVTAVPNTGAGTLGRNYNNTANQTWLKDWCAPNNVNPSEQYYIKNANAVNGTFQISLTPNGPTLTNIQNNSGNFAIGGCSGSASFKFETPNHSQYSYMNFPDQITFYHVNPAGGPPEVDWKIIEKGFAKINRISAYGVMEMDTGRAPTAANFMSITDDGKAYNLKLQQLNQNLIVKKGLPELQLISPDSKNGWKLLSNVSNEANYGLVFKSVFSGAEVDHIRLDSNSLHPISTFNLGNPYNGWNNIYSKSAVIITSDRNEKTEIGDLNEIESKVAQKIKKLFCKYKLKSAVAEKGHEARVHFGIIAQDLKEAFESEGLNPNRYAMFVENVWWESWESDIENPGNLKLVLYNNEIDAPKESIKRTAMAIRYDELLSFVIASL